MNPIRHYKTDLRCESCRESIKPFVDREPGVVRWEIDLDSPHKTLTVEGTASEEAIQAAIAKAGFQLLGEIEATPSAAPVRLESAETSSSTTYFPLLVLGAFLIGIVALVEIRIGHFDWSRAMSHFMGAFFLAFSFFKLLDLRGFAEAYRSYDIVAKKIPAYGFVYPFIELFLGIAYIIGFHPTLTNSVTLVVMTVSSIGVIQSLINKRQIRCACLGTVFNLPMSTVTLVEDALMIAMAATALLLGGH
jgi:copper chaperone CopZ